MFQMRKKHLRFFKIILMSASFILVGVFMTLKPEMVQAANSLNVGTDTSILNSGDNLFYGDLSASSNAGSNAILIQKPSGTNLFKVDSSGNMLVTGNVGIGTTAPASTLQVNGVAAVKDFVINDDYNGANLNSLSTGMGALYNKDYFQDFVQFNPPNTAEYQSGGTWYATTVPTGIFAGGLAPSPATITNGWQGYRLTWTSFPYRFLEALNVYS
jgi:hypothetical protein